MAIPLTADGRKEMIVITLALGLPAVAMVILAMTVCPWCWTLAGLLIVLWLAGLAFFRDPERTVPTDLKALVAPADGKIVEDSFVEDQPDIGGQARRLSIFLSVLDVHINRSPCSGTVRAIRYHEGEYLDARDPNSSHRNESNTIVIEPDAPHQGPVVVRQIAGLIARRIVCHLKVGDRVTAGQRIGMIKFGSRTELIVPADAGYEPAVSLGQRARGGETIMAHLASKPEPASACETEMVPTKD